MKIIFTGKNFHLGLQDKLEHGPVGAHSESYQPTYLSKELAHLGHEVVMWDCQNVQTELNNIHADALFIRGVDHLRLVINRYGYRKWKKRVFAFLDRGETQAINRTMLKEVADIIGFTCDSATDIWKNQIGTNCFTCGYGFPEQWVVPPPLPSPYRKDKKILVFLGALYDQTYIDTLDNIAKSLPDVELHIIGSRINGKAMSVSLKAPPDPCMKQVFFDADNIILHGPMKYGTFNHFLYYADLGLNFSPYVLTIIHCKVWDYLAMGLPVISMPTKNPENYLIQKTGCGILVNNGDDYIQAIKKGLETEFDRGKAASWMRENKSYKVVALRWHEQISKLGDTI